MYKAIYPTVGTLADVLAAIDQVRVFDVLLLWTFNCDCEFPCCTESSTGIWWHHYFNTSNTHTHTHLVYLM